MFTRYIFSLVLFIVPRQEIYIFFDAFFLGRRGRTCKRCQLWSEIVNSTRWPLFLKLNWAWQLLLLFSSELLPFPEKKQRQRTSQSFSILHCNLQSSYWLFWGVKSAAKKYAVFQQDSSKTRHFLIPHKIVKSGGFLAPFDIYKISYCQWQQSTLVDFRSLTSKIHLILSRNCFNMKKGQKSGQNLDKNLAKVWPKKKSKMWI